jgi:hypothetical protein
VEAKDNTSPNSSPKQSQTMEDPGQTSTIEATARGGSGWPKSPVTTETQDIKACAAANESKSRSGGSPGKRPAATTEGKDNMSPNTSLKKAQKGRTAGATKHRLHHSEKHRMRTSIVQNAERPKDDARFKLPEEDDEKEEEDDDMDVESY